MCRHSSSNQEAHGRTGTMRASMASSETSCSMGRYSARWKKLRTLIEQWRQHYNTVRPHSSLGYHPPATETKSPFQTHARKLYTETGCAIGGGSVVTGVERCLSNAWDSKLFQIKKTHCFPNLCGFNSVYNCRAPVPYPLGQCTGHSCLLQCDDNL